MFTRAPPAVLSTDVTPDVDPITVARIMLAAPLGAPDPWGTAITFAVTICSIPFASGYVPTTAFCDPEFH